MSRERDQRTTNWWMVTSECPECKTLHRLPDGSVTGEVYAPDANGEWRPTCRTRGGLIVDYEDPK